ncbi:MAG: phage head-tail connector protein [Candidatus Acidiferrales bacterium]
MSRIQVQTPPTAEPISLTTLKNHLRVTISEDDALLGLYLQGARETVESDSGRSLVNKLYRQSHDRFPGQDIYGLLGTGVGYFLSGPRYSHDHHRHERQMIKLLRCPLVNVEKITYIDPNQELQTLLPEPAQWLAGNEYEIGDVIADSNGNLQQVTAVTEAEDESESQSGATAPTWNATHGGTTTDKDLTWANVGPAPTGDFIVDADAEPPRIFPAYGTFWPLTLRVPNAVQIFFTAGYGNDAASAPANLKVAVMLAAGVSYEHRSAVTAEQLHELDWYERLIWSERVLDYAPTR